MVMLCATTRLPAAGVGERSSWATHSDTVPSDSARRRAAQDSARREGADRYRRPPAQNQAQNPRLLPDISAVGDFIGDLSPRGSTQEDGSRLGVREVEVALQAAVDPYFRGDIFLGFDDDEKVAIEQAYLTATALPWAVEARLGRFLMPFGKQNTTHRHDLHSVEYSLGARQLLDPEGLKGTGVYLSRVFSPFGFYQEVILTATDRLGEPAEGLETAEPVNKKLTGLAYSARLRNYWDLSESANIELSGSALTGVREQPVEGLASVNAVGERQSLVGADLTFRWRPLQQGLYKSFILQAEWMTQVNDVPDGVRVPGSGQTGVPLYLGPDRDFNAGYVFARWQLSRRGYVGARADVLQDPRAAGDNIKAFSGYLEFFPSEFSKLLAAYERQVPVRGFTRTNRILLQATFAIGPHKPHPF
jgi:hypothetical protein